MFQFFTPIAPQDELVIPRHNRHIDVCALLQTALKKTNPSKKHAAIVCALIKNQQLEWMFSDPKAQTRVVVSFLQRVRAFHTLSQKRSWSFDPKPWLQTWCTLLDCSPFFLKPHDHKATHSAILRITIDCMGNRMPEFALALLEQEPMHLSMPTITTPIAPHHWRQCVGQTRAECQAGHFFRLLPQLNEDDLFTVFQQMLQWFSQASDAKAASCVPSWSLMLYLMLCQTSTETEPSWLLAPKHWRHSSLDPLEVLKATPVTHRMLPLFLPPKMKKRHSNPNLPDESEAISAFLNLDAASRYTEQERDALASPTSMLYVTPHKAQRSPTARPRSQETWFKPRPTGGKRQRIT